MAVKAWISVPWRGSGQAAEPQVPNLSVDELRAAGWTLEAVNEERDLDGEPVRLTWFRLADPKGSVLQDGGTNQPPADVLERLRQDACRSLTKMVGSDDPYRPAVPDVPGVIGWGDHTGLPADAEMIPHPNVAIVEVICQDADTVTALADAGAVVWYVEEVPDAEQE